MKIEKIKITEIKVNEENPRTIQDHKFEKLVKSIKEFPEMLKIRPIVINDQGIVLGGNMRLRACIHAGLKEVYVIKASDLTPDQEKEFIIKDNVGFGQWDWEILANQFDNLTLGEWGLDVWNPEESINLDEFFEEAETDQEDQKQKIVLEYTDEDHEKVIAKFKEIGGSKEQIVWGLLGLE